MFLYLAAFVVIAFIIFGTTFRMPLNDSLPEIDWSLLRNRALGNETALNNDYLRNFSSSESLTGNLERDYPTTPDEIRIVLNKAEKLSDRISKQEINKFSNSNRVEYSMDNVSQSEREREFVFGVPNTSPPIESTSAKTLKQDNNKEHLLETLRNTIQQQTFLNSNHLHNFPLNEPQEKDAVQNVPEGISGKVSATDRISYDLD